MDGMGSGFSIYAFVPWSWMERQRVRQRQMHIAFHESCYPWSPKTKHLPIAGRESFTWIAHGVCAMSWLIFCSSPTCDHQTPVKLIKSASTKTLEDCSIQKICPLFFCIQISWRLNQPVWKISVKLNHFLKYIGGKINKYLSCHHPAVFQ